jgi:Uncharacterised ACR (DUF711)
VRLDKIAQQNNISLSIGQILPPDKYQEGIGGWAEKLVQTTSNIFFSVPISSHEIGIHFNSIRASGIDASPAPGLDASIGQAIESYSKQPFGGPATLSACALITDLLKTLDIKKCGYSGLMMPIIEDKVLAQRAMENRFTMQDKIVGHEISLHFQTSRARITLYFYSPNA